MPDDDETLSLVGAEIPCDTQGCFKRALTTCKHCWDHLPEHEKTGFKEKIERLARERHRGLRKFNLRGAELQGANLPWANLQGANLSGANLQGANLRDANLQDARLWQPDLQGADLSRAELQGADLRDANLQGANLFWANLQGANLVRADLQGADLRDANLQGAVLSWANLQETNLGGLKYDKKKTSFIKADIRNIDWSKNPLVRRDIEDQQFLQAYKEKARGSRKLRVWYRLWGLTCDYGTSFPRWLLWSLGLAIFFGFLYADYGWFNWFSRWPAVQHILAKFNPQIHIYPDGAHTFLTPYYYSIVTFTTLGFGDVIPKNLPAQVVVTAEVLLGYIMLGGLISIFANKLARRS